MTGGSARTQGERRPGWRWTPRPSPVPGIECPLLTGSIRLVESELLEHATPADREDIAQLLASVALAVSQRAPTFVLELSPRHPPALLRRVVDLLRAALLRAWSDASARASGLRVLRHLGALEDLREAVEADAVQDFGMRLAGPDGADLLAEVVHDLRSPMTSILFLADTLGQGRSGPVTPLQRRQLRLIQIAATQLSIVAGDIIDVARGGDPLQSESPAPFSVLGVLNAVRDMAHPMAEEKQLELRFVTPPRDHRCGCAFALRRILLNLLTNGLKFTHQGYVEVSVVERGATRLLFAVRDTGPGIPSEAVDRLFRPFPQAVDPHHHRFSSTGLGLVASRRLVEALGGTLSLETSPAWGTRFWFEAEFPPADSV